MLSHDPDPLARPTPSPVRDPFPTIGGESHLYPPTTTETVAGYGPDTLGGVAPRADLERGRVIELREEELFAHKELHEVGEVRVRTVVEQLPRRLEVESRREEVEVEHVPVGQAVAERQAPWQDGDTLIVPVYEEQLVVVKRLVLKEHLRIRRIDTREVKVFEDSVRSERLVIEDPSNTGLVHEKYPVDRYDADRAELDDADAEPRDARSGGLLESIKKALG